MEGRKRIFIITKLLFRETPASLFEKQGFLFVLNNNQIKLIIIQG